MPLNHARPVLVFGMPKPKCNKPRVDTRPVAKKPRHESPPNSPPVCKEQPKLTSAGHEVLRGIRQQLLDEKGWASDQTALHSQVF